MLFRSTDPRTDGGRSFAELLDSLLAGRSRPDPRVAAKAVLQAVEDAQLEGRLRTREDALLLVTERFPLGPS